MAKCDSNLSSLSSHLHQLFVCYWKRVLKANSIYGGVHVFRHETRKFALEFEEMPCLQGKVKGTLEGLLVARGEAITTVVL